MGMRLKGIYLIKDKKKGKSILFLLGTDKMLSIFYHVC